MPPVIIASAIMLGAEAAAAAGMIMATTAMYIGAAAMAAGTLLTKTPNFGNYASQSERKQVMRSSSAPVTRVYGTTELSGLMFFVEEQAGDAIKNEQLYMCLALAGHEIDGIDNIFLSDDEIGTFGDLVEYELHNADGKGSQYLVDNAPSWSADMKGEGIAWIRLTFKFDAKKFPSGLPNIKVRLRGAKLWDPRDNSTAYSENVALQILDFYRHVMKIPDNKLDLESFKTAANICDELVSIGDGKHEKRYTASGTFDLSEAPAKVLEGLHDACAGSPTYTGGKHGLLAGAYMGPAAYEIREDQIIGDVRITPETAQSERTNKITGKFVDPTIHYGESDFPPIIVQEYIAEDGREIVEDIKYRFVTSHFQAQRLANIHLNRKRIGRTLTLPMNMTGFSYRPGTYVKLFIKQLGIDGAEFRVMKFGFGLKKGVELTLREESAAVWGDSIGKPITRPPLTSLSVGGPPMPSNLRYEQQIENDIVQGVLTWTNYYTQVIGFNVVIENASDGKAIYSANVPREICHIKGLQVGSYRARVIAQGIIGQSLPAVVAFDINVPGLPDSIEVIAANWSVALHPHYAGTVAHGTLFEFWFSESDQTLANVEANAKKMGIAGYLVHEGLTPDTDYFYWVRAVNSYGRSGFKAVRAHTSADMSSVLKAVKGNIAEDMLTKDLQTKIGHIDLIIPEIPAIQELPDIKVDVLNAHNDINSLKTIDIPQVKEGIAHLEKIVSGSEGGITEIVDSIKQTQTFINNAAEAALEAATAGAEANERTVSALAEIIHTQHTEINARESLAREVTTLKASHNNLSGQVTTESEARANADTAIGHRIDQVQATAASNKAAIQTETEARTTALEAMGRQVTTVTAVAGAKNKIFYQSAAPTAGMALGDLWIDTTHANIPHIWSKQGTQTAPAWNDCRDTGIAANQAAIQTESTSRATAIEAVGKRIDTVQAAAAHNATLITQETTARTTADSALGTRIDTVQTQSNNNKAAITAETTARTTAIESLAHTVTTVQATANGKNKVWMQGTAPAANTPGLAGGDIWIDTAHGNLSHVWMGTPAPGHWAEARDAGIAANAAAVTEEKNARVSQYNSIASQVSTIKAQTDKNAAQIVANATASSDADKALGVKVDSVTAKAAANAAAITNEQKARADAVSALTSTTNQLSAMVHSGGNAILNPNADPSLPSWFGPSVALSNAPAPHGFNLVNRDNLGPYFDVVEGDVYHVSAYAATSDAAVQNLGIGILFDGPPEANRYKIVHSWARSPNWVKGMGDVTVPAGATRGRFWLQINQPSADNGKHHWTVTGLSMTNANSSRTMSAAIKTEETARVVADNAATQKIETLQTHVNNIDTSVQTVTHANATLKGEVDAGWYTKASVGSVTGGFGLNVVQDAGKTAVSAFVIDANVFKVMQGHAGATAEAVFKIQGGKVYMNAAMMDSADIGAVIAKYIHVTTLNGVNINGSHFRGGDLAIGPGGPFKFAATDTTGYNFLIDSAGNVHSHSLSVNGGDINMGNGIFHVDNAGNLTAKNGRFEGTILAQHIEGDVYAKIIKEVKETSAGGLSINEGWTHDIALGTLTAMSFARTILCSRIETTFYSSVTPPAGRFHCQLLIGGVAHGDAYTLDIAAASGSAPNILCHVSMPEIVGSIPANTAGAIVYRMTWSKGSAGQHTSVLNHYLYDDRVSVEAFKAGTSLG